MLEYMNNEELLEQLKHVIREEIKASEERLTKKIEASQKDTIHVLSEVIHTGYNIQRSAFVPLKSS